MNGAAVTTTNEPQCGASGVLGEQNEPDWSYCCVVLRVPSLSPGQQRILQYTRNRSHCFRQWYKNTCVAMLSHSVAAVQLVSSQDVVHVSTWSVGKNLNRGNNIFKLKKLDYPCWKSTTTWYEWLPIVFL